jgi:endonuclease/exonuclease/phosphatase family metal-dependent hydrolase
VPETEQRIRVATYNVHRCLGSDGRHDPERVAAVIHEIRPDAIALQEVNSRAGVERGIDQVDFLARATAMYPIAGPALRDHRGECGNAILTRFPVLTTRRIDVSVPGREPRGLLDVMLDAHGRTLRLVSTHLGLAWRERRKQVALLVELMRDPGEDLLVVLGDMNDWFPLGSSLAPLRRILGTAPRLPTFPARRPTLALDRIWCRPARALHDVRVHASALARQASDHLPLRAEIHPARGASTHPA